MLLVSSLNAQTQLKSWYLSGKEFNMQTAPSTLTGTIGGSTSGSNGPQNGIYDETGAIQFYINGGIIYNKNHIMEGSIPTGSSNFGYDRTDFAIVPFANNNSCQNKYYLFYTDSYRESGVLGVRLYGKSVEVNKTTGDLDIQNLNSGNPLSTLSASTGSYNGVQCFASIAVSNAVNGKRYLYWVAGYNSSVIYTLTTYPGKVSKIDITAPTAANPSGLSTAVNLSIPASVLCYSATEADLSVDGTKLVWGCSRYQTGNKAEFYIINLNSSGTYSSHTSFTSTISAGSFRVRGVEFTSDGSKLFYTTGSEPSTSAAGVFVRNLTNNTDAYISGSHDYGNSQIERAANGLMYVAKNGVITSIDPTSNSFTTETIAISPPEYPTGYLLPDQIDGCNYDNFLFPTATAFDYTTYNASGVATWTTSSNPINTSGQPIRIQNTLRFTGGAGTNITISGMVFEFGENAKIILDPGVRLNLFNTTLRAHDCAMMWEGIEVSDNATLTTNSTPGNNPVSTYILDAHNAISTNRDQTKSHNSITLQIQMTEFDHNHQHILLINAGGPSISINNNRFLHSTTLRDQSGTWGVMDPTSFQYYGRSSIEVLNYLSPITLTTTIKNNLFHRGYRGINVYRASIIALQNTFQSMSYISGVGIYVNSGYSLNTITATGNTFHHIYRAFHELYSAHVNFIGNTVYSTTTSAVYVANNKDCKHTINGNTFSNCKVGAIVLSSNAGSINGNGSEITVANNTISTENQSTGITISEAGKSSSPSYLSLYVNGNIMSNLAFGIKMYNIVGYQNKMGKPNGVGTSDIVGNTINFYSTYTSNRATSDYNMGIFLSACKGLRILTNTISTATTKSWRNCGIESNNTTSTLISGNNITAGRGISGIENALDNNYTCNTFNNNVNGISLGDHKLRTSGDVHGIFYKESRDNTFIGSTDVDIELYLWHINPAITANLTMNIANNKWIFLPKIPSMTIYPNPNVAYGNPLTKKHSDYLYANLGGERSICNNNPDVAPPSLWGPPNSDYVNDQLYFWQWQYEYEKELKAEGQGQINKLFINQLLDVEQYINDQIYNQANQILITMQPENAYEQNIKTVYEILIDVMLNDHRTLTTSEISTLTAIAEGQTYDNGPAVLDARNLLWTEEGIEFTDGVDHTSPITFNIAYDPCYDQLPDLKITLVDDQNNAFPDIPITIDTPGRAHLSGFEINNLDPKNKYSFVLDRAHSPLPFLSIEDWQNTEGTITSLCETNRPASTTTGTLSVEKERVNIYPNPFTENFTISLNTITAEHIEVVDIMGRVIYTSNLLPNAQLISINSSTWSKGTYIVKIYNNKEVIQSHKLIKM